LLTRQVDIYPSGPTIEENIFRGAKRICIVFAVFTATLSGLDLAGISTVENDNAFVNDSRLRVAYLPNRIRSRLDYISPETAPPSTTVMIPRDTIVKTAGPVVVSPETVAIKINVSPVAVLADVDHEDAV
jgi:hypothetical protein